MESFDVAINFEAVDGHGGDRRKTSQVGDLRNNHDALKLVSSSGGNQ